MIAGGAGLGHGGSSWPHERVRCNPEASCVDEGFTKQGNTIWFHLLRDALSKADVCLEGCGRSRETTEDAVVTAQAELTA